jgi:hypothetical protein
MYLEANLMQKEEPNAIEVNRSLVLEGNQIFVVRRCFDMIDVNQFIFF